MISAISSKEVRPTVVVNTTWYSHHHSRGGVEHDGRSSPVRRRQHALVVVSSAGRNRVQHVIHAQHHLSQFHALGLVVDNGGQHDSFQLELRSQKSKGRTVPTKKVLGLFQGTDVLRIFQASIFLGIRPMTMATRCSKVFFPDYSKKKPAQDTVVTPLWGTREINVRFSRNICSRCCTGRNLRFHVENCQHADQKQLTRRHPSISTYKQPTANPVRVGQGQ